MYKQKNAHSRAQQSPRRERVKLFSYNLLIIRQLSRVGGGNITPYSTRTTDEYSLRATVATEQTTKPIFSLWRNIFLSIKRLNIVSDLCKVRIFITTIQIFNKKSPTPKSDFNFFGYPQPDLLSQGSYANVRLT